MEKASDTLRNQYYTDPELTEFTVLDTEQFYETR